MGTPQFPHGPDDLDEHRRARIRSEVLSGVRHRPPTLRDRAYEAVALVGLPAPHLVRILVSAALVLGVVTSATVASAEALPDQPLYPVKLATEEIRLALAQTPEDRAAVRLSMAEHRLIEAQNLALEGLEPEAIIASSTYGADLASAAAELASVERVEPQSAPVVAQLRQRLVEQQRLASRVAAQLAADPVAAKLAPVFRTVASLPPSLAPNTTLSEAIAQHAADITAQLVVVADQLAGGTSVTEAGEATGAGSAGLRTTPRLAGLAPARAPTSDEPAARPASEGESHAGAREPSRRPPGGVGQIGVPERGTVSTPERGTVSTPEHELSGVPEQQERAHAPTVHDPHSASEAALRARQQAEKAREAAKKAKEEAKRPPPPHKEKAKH